MYGIDIMYQGIIGKAQISFTLDTAAFQTAAFIAIIASGIECIEIDAIVQATNNGIGFAMAEWTIVGTAITASAAITEFITIAQSIWNRGEHTSVI